jgi:hypothetical protein
MHGKPRIELSLTEEALLSTTKSDGMWKVYHLSMIPHLAWWLHMSPKIKHHVKAS